MTNSAEALQPYIKFAEDLQIPKSRSRAAHDVSLSARSVKTAVCGIHISCSCTAPVIGQHRQRVFVFVKRSQGVQSILALLPAPSSIHETVLNMLGSPSGLPPEPADPGAVCLCKFAVSDSVSAASRRQQLADLRGNETSFAEHSSTLAFERRQSMSASLMHHCLHQPLLAGPRHSLLRQCTPDATSLTSLQRWHTAKQLHTMFFHLCFRLQLQRTAGRFSALTLRCVQV